MSSTTSIDDTNEIWAEQPTTPSRHAVDVSDLDPLASGGQSTTEEYTNLLGSLVPATSKLEILSDEEGDDEENEVEDDNVRQTPTKTPPPVPEKTSESPGFLSGLTTLVSHNTPRIPSPFGKREESKSDEKSQLYVDTTSGSSHDVFGSQNGPSTPESLLAPTPGLPEADEKTQEPDRTTSVVLTPPPERPVVKYDFQAFGNQMRHRGAEPINKYFKSFVREFLRKAPTSTTNQTRAVHDFMVFIEEKMRRTDPWRTALETAEDPEFAEEQFEVAVDCMEKLVMTRLYHVTFSPATEKDVTADSPVDQPSATGDIERDHVLSQRIKLFSWIEPRHLDLPITYLYEEEEDETDTSEEEVSSSPVTEANDGPSAESDGDKPKKEKSSERALERGEGRVDDTEETHKEDEKDEQPKPTPGSELGTPVSEDPEDESELYVTKTKTKTKKVTKKISQERGRKARLRKQYEGLLLNAQEQLNKVNDYRAPRDKMICILNCCKIIFNILRLVSKDESADSFIPFLVYTVLRANPDHLVSNIQYIQRFRSPEHLRGEAGYYLSSLSGVVSFIETMDYHSLSHISQEEFESKVEQAIHNLNSEKTERKRVKASAKSELESDMAPMESDEVSPEVVSTDQGGDLPGSSSYPRLPQFLMNSSGSVERIVSRPLNVINKVFTQFTSDSSDSDSQPSRTYPLPSRPRSQHRLSSSHTAEYPGNTTSGSPYRQIEPQESNRRPSGRRSSLLPMYAPENMTDEQAAQEIERQDVERRTAYLSTLKGMFPNLDTEVLEVVLLNNAGNLDRTIDVLLEMS